MQTGRFDESDATPADDEHAEEYTEQDKDVPREAWQELANIIPRHAPDEEHHPTRRFEDLKQIDEVPYTTRGGRDKPVTPDQPQLTPLEVSSVNDWIHRFVLSLQDKTLINEAMNEPINHGVLPSDSLRFAVQIVKKSSGLLNLKAKMARAVAQ
ncbi:hypothetical protein E4U50_005115 [Claviceps purpurea]|nr:hypothetical protein E4U50_005115 [Claviceps purpurea]